MSEQARHVSPPDRIEVHRDAGPSADAHPPGSQFSQRRSRMALVVVLEVVLISAGVFPGLMGEQWRENAQNREPAAIDIHPTGSSR